jgi:hypothetical protein
VSQGFIVYNVRSTYNGQGQEREEKSAKVYFETNLKQVVIKA